MTPAGSLVLWHDAACGWQWRQPAALPVDRLVLGRTAEEAVGLVALIYSICAAAQAVVTRRALGLPVGGHLDALRAERLREHHRKLWLVLPPLIGAPAGASPRPMAGETPADFRDWMASTTDPAAAVARHLAAMDPARGRSPALPAAEAPDWPDPTIRGRAAENSLALSLGDHPLMRSIEAERGRGPLWRLALKLLDYTRLAAGAPVDDPAMTARGRLFVRAALQDGRVTDFARLTPTDFLLAPGGIMAALLAGTPPGDPDLALLVELADPCLPWLLLREAPDA